MSAFPITFSEESIPLDGVLSQSETGCRVVAGLAELGLRASYGLTEAEFPEIMGLANLDDIVEFCPNDKAGKRFNAGWLEKGRTFINFRTIAEGELKAYSWAGVQREDELPNHPVTTAFRSTVRENLAY
ncbi:MAG: hypothetical protein JWO47_124 [Candidatus Saccharibacteria bacterium]|nr:hypothetical protein [Candidatus Saccharibacteria bacterium]